MLLGGGHRSASRCRGTLSAGRRDDDHSTPLKRRREEYFGELHIEDLLPWKSGISLYPLSPQSDAIGYRQACRDLRNRRSSQCVPQALEDACASFWSPNCRQTRGFHPTSQAIDEQHCPRSSYFKLSENRFYVRLPPCFVKCRCSGARRHRMYRAPKSLHLPGDS